MGFSIRGRTKGKNAWFNYSSSSKGPRGSVSVKSGRSTFNFSKYGSRFTYNFGNGIRWTSYRKNAKPYSLSMTKTLLSILMYISIAGLIIAYLR